MRIWVIFNVEQNIFKKFENVVSFHNLPKTQIATS